MSTTVTYTSWEPPSFPENDGFKGAQKVLEWAYSHYSPQDISYASSFGAEAVVLIDLITGIKPDAHIIFLDTGLHFPETYEVIERVQERFPELNIERKLPSLSLDDQREAYGPALWKREPDRCCSIRKIIPLQEAMKDKIAWISGLRRDQSASRAGAQFLNKDSKFQNVKICPLIHWTWEEVWEHIRKKDLPYNNLHDNGYPSIGCFPCTRAAGVGGDSRAGRWAGTGKTECGLHSG
ncbi:MAG: phosphoadenylyl-sulfate reductase [Bacillota bacterium]